MEIVDLVVTPRDLKDSKEGQGKTTGTTTNLLTRVPGV